MARAKRTQTTAPAVPEPATETAGGAPINEATRGARPKTAQVQQAGAQMDSAGQPAHPDLLPTKGPEDIQGRDQTERELNKPVDEAANEESKAVVDKYIVTRGGMILANGSRTRMAEGKLVDSLNYNIAKLKRQGIKLRPATEDDLY